MTRFSTSTVTITETETETEAQLPNFWKIVFHNDDTTSFDFVLLVLVAIYEYTPNQAVDFATVVHETGSGTAGIYPHEIAQTKYEQTLEIIAQYGVSLQISMVEDK